MNRRNILIREGYLSLPNRGPRNRGHKHFFMKLRIPFEKFKKSLSK
jgi:hypothetical protein